MKASPLRVLIVDSSDAQRMIIEKTLSLNGCFRIAPAESFAQLLIYTQYALRPFDIVLVNSEVAIDSGIDIYSFCTTDVNIHHFIVYNTMKFDVLSFDMSRSKVKATLPGALDANALQALIAMIEVNSKSTLGAKRVSMLSTLKIPNTL